jgi:hypothetical protein
VYYCIVVTGFVNAARRRPDRGTQRADDIGDNLGVVVTMLVTSKDVEGDGEGCTHGEQSQGKVWMKLKELGTLVDALYR